MQTLPGGRDGVAVSDALQLLRRSWAWILGPTLAVFAAASVFVQVVPPRYTAEAKILLENRDPAFARTVADRNEPPPLDEQGVASQVQLAMSRDLAREAIRRLKLVGNPEFDPSSVEIGPLRRASAWLGIGKPAAGAKPEDRVLEAYFDRLLVYPAGKSRILSVEFRAGDPILAANAANTVSELYLGSLEAAKVDTARYASTWLGANIDGLRARVADAEARVEAFRARNGLIGSGGAAGQPIGGQQLGELSSQLSQARTIRADLTGRVKLLKEMIKDGRAFEIPDVANNELIRRTVESRMTLRAQLALESRTLLPGHPRMKELTAQLDDLEIQIKAAAERIVRTLENDAKIAGARVDSLQGAVDGQRDVVAQGNASEIQLRALEREAKVQREQLESYLSRYREAAARHGESATPAEARIVSRAAVPDMPSFPKKVPVVAVATAMAFMLSVASMLGRHLLRTPAETGAAVAEPTGNGDATPSVADRFDYPEPLPPREGPPQGQPERLRDLPISVPFGSAKAGFGSPYTVHARFPQLVTEGGSRLPVAASSQAGSSGSAASFDLDALIARLRAVRTQAGRCVLVVETAQARGMTRGLAGSLLTALSAHARTLDVDVGGRPTDPQGLGLTDLIAGEAAFLDVLHRTTDPRQHQIRPGFASREVLLEEPEGLAIALNAMTQSYEWTVCHLYTGNTDGVEDAVQGVVSVLSACADSVVIASEVDADDAGLAALYGLALEAGAGQVLVARDRDAVVTSMAPGMELRLSA